MASDIVLLRDLSFRSPFLSEPQLLEVTSREHIVTTLLSMLISPP